MKYVWLGSYIAVKVRHKVASTSVLPIKRLSNQTESKPQQSNALHPNELGLGRIRVKQPRVRPRRGTKGQILLELTFRLGSYATKGDTLISRVEYEFWSSVGTLKDCGDLTRMMCSTVPDGWVKPCHASTHRLHSNEPPQRELKY